MTESFGKPAAPAGKGRGQAEDRADGVPRDARGGYVLPGLDGSPPLLHKNGNPIGRVRASTIKNHVTDKTGIEKWKKELVVRGLSKDPALMTEAMKATAADDKTWIRNVAERAITVAGGKVAADRGTQFHELTERIKKGEQVSPDEIHESLAAVDVDAYLQLLAEVNLRPVPGMQERVVLLEHGGGGTFDDMFEWFNPDTEQYELLIGDTKSGRDIWKYGSLEIIAQMIQYTRAQGIWRSPKDGGAEPWGDYLPMPAVSQSHVAIVHAPQNGTAEAFIVDIAGAQEVIDAALTIRRWQSDAKHRVRSIGKVDLREAAYVAPGNSVSGTTAITEAFHQPVPDGPWAPVRQDTTVTSATITSMTPEGQPAMTNIQVSPPPTPDQLAQIDKRNERLAVAAETVARVASASDPNTDGDNDNPPYSVIEQTMQRVTGTELAPLAGPGKRGCGVCGRTGHKRGSPKCLGDADPAKQTTPALGTEPLTDAERELVVGEIVGGITVPAYLADHGLARPAETFPGQVTAEELAAYNAKPTTVSEQIDQEMSDGDHDTRQSAARAVADRQRGLPYCHLAHTHGWTSTYPGAVGQWVCATTGKPSREAYEGSASQGPYAKPLPSPAITPADAEAPTEPAHWTTPPDMTAWSITNARNQADVLVIRAKAIATGTWSDAYESQAQARYQALGS